MAARSGVGNPMGESSLSLAHQQSLHAQPGGGHEASRHQTSLFGVPLDEEASGGTAEDRHGFAGSADGFDDLDGPGHDRGKRQGVRLNVPIMVFIAAATFISSAASMAGGLVLYHSSLASLKDTVRATSANDVANLKKEILEVFGATSAYSNDLMDYLYNDHIVQDNNASAWVQSVRWNAFAKTRRSYHGQYASGVVLIPRPDDTTPPLYSMVWADPLRDGSREFMFGSSLGSDGDASSSALNVTTWVLNEDTGRIRRYAYNWDASSYLALLGTWAPHDQGLPPQPVEPGSVWERGTPPAVAQKWRAPQSWFSSQGTEYSFSGVDAIFAPPPAPHPWAGYRAVLVASLFVYSSWEKPLLRYGETNDKTTVFVYDRVHHYIYASTTGHRMVDQACFDARFGPGQDTPELYASLKCASTVSDLKPAFRDAIQAANHTANGEFIHDSFDGTQYFARRDHITLDVHIIWLQETAAVQSRVNEALYYLIFFTLLVLAFDLSVYAGEIVFIALPLRNLASAIEGVGNMQVDTAARRVSFYKTRTVMVREIRALMRGMDGAVHQLRGYRSFIPESVLSGRISARSVLTQPPTPPNVAFVFTDIVCSTDLWEGNGPAMADAMDTHNAVMRRAIEASGGYEVKTIGDAFMVAFQHAAQALEFGCAVQLGLLQADWSPDLVHLPQAEERVVAGDTVLRGLRVRMGGHCGPVQMETNPVTERSDYRGGAVNKAARIESAALPGMFAISEEMVQECGGAHTAGDSEVAHYAVKELKGIGTVTLYHARHARLRGRDVLFENIKRSADGKTLKPCINPLQVPHSSDGRHSGSLQSSASVRTRRASPPVDDHFERRLKKLEGSVAVVRMGALSDAMCRTDEAAHIFGALNATLQMLIDCAGMTEAKIECLVGSTVHASWNLGATCASFVPQSLRFAGQVAKKGTKLQVGLCAGPMFHGVAGSAQRRYHTVLGPGVLYATYVSDLCALYDAEALAVFHAKPKVAFTHCSYPVDLFEGVRDYAPIVAVERLIAEHCTAIEIGWSAALAEQSNSFAACDAYTSYRDLVHSAGRAQLDGTREPKEASRMLQLEEGSSLPHLIRASLHLSKKKRLVSPSLLRFTRRAPDSD